METDRKCSSAINKTLKGLTKLSYSLIIAECSDRGKGKSTSHTKRHILWNHTAGFFEEVLEDSTWASRLEPQWSIYSVSGFTP